MGMFHIGVAPIFYDASETCDEAIGETVFEASLIHQATISCEFYRVTGIVNVDKCLVGRYSGRGLGLRYWRGCLSDCKSLALISLDLQMSVDHPSDRSLAVDAAGIIE